MNIVAACVRTAVHPGRVLGALAVLGLLTAFAGVVREAVAQADASRRASALLDEARWRCKALKLPRQRDDCLRLFHHERPGDSAALQLLVGTAAAAHVALLGPSR
jgi:hypothetical protein